MTGEGNSSINPANARRVVIENVQPQVDCGRFPIKRIVGDRVAVTADIFVDGHDILHAVLATQACTPERLGRSPDGTADPTMSGRESSAVPTEGRHLYTLQAWIDHFQSWSRDLGKKFEAAQDLSVDILAGVQLIEAAAARASGKDKSLLTATADRDTKAGRDRHAQAPSRNRRARTLQALMIRNADRRRRDNLQQGTRGDRRSRKGPLQCLVRNVSAFLLPRNPDDTELCKTAYRRLDYVAGMGFDVLYLPPIHPIGRVNRKGKNNDGKASPDDVGSPWAIGATEGGHKAIDPKLGTLEDFKQLRCAGQAVRTGSSARPGLPVRARPSLCEGTQGLVPHPSRWQRAVCREPTEEVSGHLSSRFRDRKEQRALGRTKERGALLDRPGYPYFSRRQSAHQAFRFLGVADHRHQKPLSRRPVSCGSVHSPESDVRVGQVGIHSVLHLFCLAQHQA